MGAPDYFDEDTSTPVHGPAITDASASVAAPTKAEFDAVVTKLNAVLAALRSANVIATD